MRRRSQFRSEVGDRKPVASGLFADHEVEPSTVRLRQAEKLRARQRRGKRERICRYSPILWNNRIIRTIQHIPQNRQIWHGRPTVWIFIGGVYRHDPCCSNSGGHRPDVAGRRGRRARDHRALEAGDGLILRPKAAEEDRCRGAQSPIRGQQRVEPHDGAVRRSIHGTVAGLLRLRPRAAMG